jgi:hypothetical protein
VYLWTVLADKIIWPGARRALLGNAYRLKNGADDYRLDYRLIITANDVSNRLPTA